MIIFDIIQQLFIFPFARELLPQSFFFQNFHTSENKSCSNVHIPHTWRTADKEPKWPWARDCIYAGCQWYSVKWMRWDVSRDSAFKLCYSSGTCVCNGACLNVESCFIFFAETWQQERRSPAQGLFRWRISLRTQPLIKWKHCLVFLVKSRRCICSLSEFKLIIPTDVSIN